MGMIWHRSLVAEDVATAHRLLDQHQPTYPYRAEPFCANALHWNGAPRWPCDRVRWAREVLAAEKRGEVGDAPGPGVSGQVT